MASIFVMTGTQKGDYYPLGRRTNVVGRDEALLIQVLDDRVSRKHMRIGFNADTNLHYVADMNSRHGVFVNGSKITDETVLNDGDYITIGGTGLLFTEKDFDDHESALSHFKKVGERERPTNIDFDQ
ncbi:MAG: FHA domain-containing protein [Planctomycetota bacterium]|jgi:pSer/pThr/pTyr-binding forkhead associated (FHA) protein